MDHSKIIAKNTFFLYLRTVLILFLTIYTSRVLLRTLGVNDFGIYNLVAGVVALFSSLKMVFVSAIQRFLNYEKGKNNLQKQRQIFSLSLLVHIIIAIVFIAVVGIFGDYFIPNKLNLPDNTVSIALFVFHFSILTAVFTILSTPYNAAIIANEKIDFYAGISIAEAGMTLLATFMLEYISYNQLRIYAIMIAAIGALKMISYIIYCIRFKECSIQLCWDKTLFKQLVSFAGWNLMGNTAFALVNEGINMILNIFGGVVANAARAIAYQVRSAAAQLTANILIPSQPHIIQQAANDTRLNVFKNINRISRIIFFIMAVTLIPIIVYCKNVLSIWLTEIPDHAAEFVRLSLIHMILRSLHGPIDILFKAFGTIKRYQIVDSIILVTALPLSYFILKSGAPLHTVFWVMIAIELLNLWCIAKLADNDLGFSIKNYIHTVIIPCSLVFAALSVVASAFNMFLSADSGFQAICYIVLLSCCCAIIVYIFALDNIEKSHLNQWLISGCKKFKLLSK